MYKQMFPTIQMYEICLTISVMFSEAVPILLAKSFMKYYVQRFGSFN